MKTLNDLYEEAYPHMPTANPHELAAFRKRLPRHMTFTRRRMPNRTYRWVLDQDHIHKRKFPPQLEHSILSGYALQEDVHQFYHPEMTLQMFIRRFPYKAIRKSIGGRKKNFYHYPHPEPREPAAESPEEHPSPSKPRLIELSHGHLEHALLMLQDRPRFSLHTLYMFYTQKMHHRPSMVRFPKLAKEYLTPGGLKAILKMSRWPV